MPIYKYVRATSIEIVLFQLSVGDIVFYNYRHEANEGKEAWEKVFRIQVDEV